MKWGALGESGSATALANLHQNKACGSLHRTAPDVRRVFQADDHRAFYVSFWANAGQRRLVGQSWSHAFFPKLYMQVLVDYTRLMWVVNRVSGRGTIPPLDLSLKQDTGEGHVSGDQLSNAVSPQGNSSPTWVCNAMRMGMLWMV